MRNGGRIHMPSFRPQVLAMEADLTQQILSALRTADPIAPGLNELSASLQIDLPDIKQSMRRAAQRGLVVEFSKDRYLLAERAHILASVVRTLADASPEHVFSVRTFSDRSGIGRNLAVQILEYFDRTGLTRRVGDTREVLKPAEFVFDCS